MTAEFTIQALQRECVVALFANKLLAKSLVLKGGTALHLIEGLDTRLSTDIDFSVEGQIQKPANYFNEVEDALTVHFKAFGYEVIDAKHQRKPKEKAAASPRFWGGWAFDFKLSSLSNKELSIERKRREALVPDGANSSKIEIEISEYEFCGAVEHVKLDGTEVVTYSSHVLILEKIRAICQQHAEYPHGRSKNRARDYYDIFNLVRVYRSYPEFLPTLRKHLAQVFAAKEVETGLLDKIFEEDFLAEQRSHWAGVVATVKGKIESFDYYVEQLRFLIREIRA